MIDFYLFITLSFSYSIQLYSKNVNISFHERKTSGNDGINWTILKSSDSDPQINSDWMLSSDNVQSRLFSRHRKLVESGDIFWNHLSDEEFLNEIKTAEKQLKIYIYPIPHDNITIKLEDNILPHFKSEFLYREYLRYFDRNTHIPLNDSRKGIITNNPDEATAFLIDHDWMRYTLKDCNGAIDKHISQVIHNVIDLHPYYNRSGGRDHFFMGVYDHGAFCDMACDHHGDKSILNRISGVSVIGNYGMDRETFFIGNSVTLREKYKRYGVPCHRSDRDIVIPQLIHQKTLDLFRKYSDTHIPYREFDATFSGSNWGERAPAKKMEATADIDFTYNGTEKYGFYIMGGSPDNSLKYRGYFMYHPCGIACWSQRLYEALAVYTIPIIVTDGGIQAFERFIDWRRFTVKMSLSTWYNDTARTIYRRKIRKEGDNFRQKLRNCWISLNISIDFAGLEDYRQQNTTWIDHARTNRGSICSEILNTLYWRKSEAIRRVVPWLDFNKPHQTEKNAFRLLTLEIWCHSMSWKMDKVPFICEHKSDFTSRLEYFE